MNYNLNKYPSNDKSVALSRGRRYRKNRKLKRLRFLLIAVILSLMIAALFNVFSTYGSTHKNNFSVETPPNNNLIKDDQVLDAGTIESVLDQPEEEANKGTYTDSDENNISVETPNDNGSIIQDDQVLDADMSEPIFDQPEEENKGKYDGSGLVPKSEAVDISYFDDAVFIGDSRTEGFILSTGLSNATAYTQKGLMVDTVFTNPVVNMDGKKISVMEALKKTSFSKVYIMLGINETGWPYSNLFIKKYGEIIDEIKNINPEAIIYVQSILPVSQKVSSSHSYLKNTKINEYNLLIQQMIEEKEVYYINSAESVATSDGYLPEEAATDGIHLKKDYCDKWLEYLKTHTINAH